jgi:hypothetical protein
LKWHREPPKPHRGCYDYGVIKTIDGNRQKNIMTNLNQFFKEILELNFVSGGYQESEHEIAVENALFSNGFLKSKIKKITKLQRNLALNGGDIPGLKEGEYISQPTGKNDSPDFIIRYKGKLYFIECKSSKTTHPTYNGGLPKEEYIYIFTSKATNETTIFYGKDVVSLEKRELYSELLVELNEILHKYQNIPEWKDDSRGFDYYIRNMYTQSGGSEKTDYFTHKERLICEQNVLNSIR